MKLIDCVNAYSAVLALMEKDCNYQTAYALVRLKRKLQPHVEFFLSEENKLVDRYAEKKDGKVAWTPRGTFKFERPEMAVEYDSKRTELAEIGVYEAFEKVRLFLPETALVKPIHLEHLIDFAIFEEVKIDG